MLTVRFANEKKLNAWTMPLMAKLFNVLGDAATSADVKGVVVTGTGKYYSAGVDLSSMIQPMAPAKLVRQIRDQNEKCFSTFLNFPKPIVAAVQGYCIWHGCAVLSCADVIFAADNARFLPFFLQYFSMPFEIGVRKAKELIFRQRFMMPEEAERVGFVNNIVPLEDLAET